MFKLMNRLPKKKVILALIFLLVQTTGAIYLPYIAAKIINIGIMEKNLIYIWNEGIFMFLIAGISTVGQLLNTYISAKISYEMSYKLRGDVFKKVLRFSKKNYDEFGAASLITRSINDIIQVQQLVEMSLKFLIIAPFYLIGGIILTYRLNAKLSFIFIGAMPFLIIGTVGIYYFANPIYSKMQKLVDKLNLLFREGLTGVKVIRAFRMEEEDYLKYKEVNENYANTAIKAGTIMNLFSPFIILILNLATILAVWMGARLIVNGSVEIGTIIAVISYSAQILMGFSLLTNVILMLPKGKISCERINEILQVSETPKNDGDLDNIESLQVKNIQFTYPKAKKKALENIDFKIEKGKTLAIIGRTGAGKSSLLNIITGVYKADEGEIKFGDKNIEEISQSNVNEKISFTFQKPKLIMGTIRDNMMLAKLDATDEEIWKALELAEAKDFVENLDKGLDSAVEKNGENFSGGQKQRLSIARALLKEAGIYIFDDSFSALDFKTESIIRSRLKEKLNKVITIIVAQRINTIIDADLIAVLDKGKIVDIGTNDELRNRSELYKEIISSQTYKEELYEKR